MHYEDTMEPGYMPLVAPNCHVQVPVLSAIGKGPKGDKGDTGDNIIYFDGDKEIPVYSKEYIDKIIGGKDFFSEKNNVYTNTVSRFPWYTYIELEDTGISLEERFGTVQGCCLDLENDIVYVGFSGNNKKLAKYNFADGSLIGSASVPDDNIHSNSLDYDTTRDHLIITDLSTSKIYILDSDFTVLSSPTTSAFGSACYDFENDQACFFPGTTNKYLVAGLYDKKIPVSMFCGETMVKKAVYLQDATAVPDLNVFLRLSSGNGNKSFIDVIGYNGTFFGTIYWITDNECEGIFVRNDRIYIIDVLGKMFSFDSNIIKNNYLTHIKPNTTAGIEPYIEGYIIDQYDISASNAGGSTVRFKFPKTLFFPGKINGIDIYSRMLFLDSGSMQINYRPSEMYFNGSGAVRIIYNCAGLSVQIAYSKDASNENIQKVAAVDWFNAVTSSRSYISSNIETNIQTLIGATIAGQLSNSYNLIQPSFHSNNITLSGKFNLSGI